MHKTPVEILHLTTKERWVLTRSGNYISLDITDVTRKELSLDFFLVNYGPLVLEFIYSESFDRKKKRQAFGKIKNYLKQKIC